MISRSRQTAVPISSSAPVQFTHSLHAGAFVLAMAASGAETATTRFSI
ncbi:hypothetical protein [Brucella grignonensis]|uniref:Uncharacterized protein n=1 Tax=Brucella grignonensis TaxID=94627 RepID=A0A256EYX9_9HYPH|nr:hypothetical protein [Brucella grignonensis]OYR07797.1 hypothetical protein CEV33_3602 [Brucella grignonensis]